MSRVLITNLHVGEQVELSLSLDIIPPATNPFFKHVIKRNLHTVGNLFTRGGEIVSMIDAVEGLDLLEVRTPDEGLTLVFPPDVAEMESFRDLLGWIRLHANREGS